MYTEVNKSSCEDHSVHLQHVFLLLESLQALCRRNGIKPVPFLTNALMSVLYTSGTGHVAHTGTPPPTPPSPSNKLLARISPSSTALCWTQTFFGTSLANANLALRGLGLRFLLRGCSNDLKNLLTTRLHCRHTKTAVFVSLCTYHVGSDSNMKFKSLTVRRGIVMRPPRPFAHTARAWRCSGGGGYWAQIGCKGHKPPLEGT